MVEPRTVQGGVRVPSRQSGGLLPTVVVVLHNQVSVRVVGGG
jgi:hypothetical protein